MSAAIVQLGVDRHDRWCTAGMDGARPNQPMAHADPCHTDHTGAWLEEGRSLLAALTRPKARMDRGRRRLRHTPPVIKRHSA